MEERLALLVGNDTLDAKQYGGIDIDGFVPAIISLNVADHC